MLTLICYLLLNGCGPLPKYKASAELRPFIDAHIALGGVSADGLEVRIAPPGGERIVGRCRFLGGGATLVTLDPTYWETADYYQKQALIHHELGHCLRNMGHRGSCDEKGDCDSLMHHQVLSKGLYEKNRVKYDLELIRGY